MLTSVDYAIIGIVVLSLLVSLSRGFLREALSLLSWILACWVALTFTAAVDALMAPYLPEPVPRPAAAFLLLFVGTLIVTALLTYLVSLLVESRSPSLADRIFAMVFGALRAGVIVTLLVLLSGLSVLPQRAAWQESMLLPHFERAASSVRALLPATISPLFPQ